MRRAFTCTVADQDDVEIVWPAEEVAEIPGWWKQTSPDCVIFLRKAGERPNILWGGGVTTLLGLYPDIKILAVTTEVTAASVPSRPRFTGAASRVRRRNPTRLARKDRVKGERAVVSVRQKGTSLKPTELPRAIFSFSTISRIWLRFRRLLIPDLLSGNPGRLQNGFCRAA